MAAVVKFDPYTATVENEVWHCPENLPFEELLNLTTESRSSIDGIRYVPGDPDNDIAQIIAEQLGGEIVSLGPESDSYDNEVIY